MTTPAHQHTHPVQPPAGSIWNPGPCACGTTYDQAQAETQLADAIKAMADAGGTVTEYGLLMSGGGFHVRNGAPEIERIYPVTTWAQDKIRNGGHVFRRRIIVVDDWAELDAKDVQP